ncbi:MAG: nuclear transport factor 2 family protein [Cypionkella sp.]
MTDKFDTFTDLLRDALGARLSASDDPLEIFAQDVIFTFPFAPEGLPMRLEGRTALAGHMTKLGPLITFGQLSLGNVFPSGDTVIFEFSCAG